MATLAETINGTSGLIAYWPLINHTDQSGNGRHLTVMGSPAFGASPMTTDQHPSLLTQSISNRLSIQQSTLPKIKAVEGWFRLAGTKGGGVYSTVIGLNQPTSGFNSRYILLYQETLGFCSYQSISPAGGNTTYPSASNNWDKLSEGYHHFVLQLNAAGTQTEVYIDGVKDTGMTVPLDIFMQSAGLYLVVGDFLYNGSANGGNAQLSDFAIYDRPLTTQEISDRQSYPMPPPVWRLQPLTVIAANKEPRSQFQPQDVAWRGSPGAVYSGPMFSVQIRANMLCAGYSMQWIRDGVQNALQGYIESTVTISGEGVKRRVLCFDQAGNLEGETWSRASDGKYRFDRLWMNRRYMLVAQDDPAFGPADYNAVAADFQLPTPYAPGQGVGLTGG